MILHVKHNDDEAKDRAIILRSPDTDVFVLLLTYCQSLSIKVFYEIGGGDKDRLIDIKQMIQVYAGRSFPKRSLGYMLSRGVRVIPPVHFADKEKWNL